MKLSALELSCRPLPEFDAANWNAVDDAFAACDWCALQQAWRAAPEPGFQPARVRIGWRPDALWVDAHLTDLDIFNAATHLNDKTYGLGDIFEIFALPAAQQTYYEFHITPENQQLQLRWPDFQAIDQFSGGHESLAPFFVTGMLQSRTEVQPQRNFWRVLARVPATIAQSEIIREGDAWMFSFSRYDTTRGVAEPVHSSSSPHAEINFHRRHEWGRINFSSK